jgi:hypothetical protein
VNLTGCRDRKSQEQTELISLDGREPDVEKADGNTAKEAEGSEAGTDDNMTEKAVHDILTKVDWKDDGVRKTCGNIRQYQHALGYSESWMTEYVYNIVLLAKKEPKPKA